MARNWIKKALIAGAILFGLCVAIVVSFSLYLNTNHAKKFIEARLSATIPGSITFKAIRLSLWRGQADLKGLVLRGASHEAIAGFDRLFVNLAWAGFLDGDLTVETFLLEKPWAEIRATEEDGVNLLRALAPPRAPERLKKEEPTKGAPFNLVVQSLEILGGRAVYHDPSAQLVASLQDISLMANGDMLQESGSLDLRLGKVRLECGQINSGFDEVALQAKLEEKSIVPVRMKIAMGSSKLNISGSVQDVFDDPTFDMVTELALFLPDLQERLPVKPRLAGSAKGRMTLQGTPNDPRITFHLDCEGGRFGEVRMDRLTLDCSLKDRLFVLQSLWANTAEGNVEVSGEAHLDEAFADGFLGDKKNLEAISYRLSMAAKNVEPATFFPSATGVKGNVDAKFAVEGRGLAPNSLSAKAMLEVFGANMTWHGHEPATDWRVEGKANFVQNTVTVEQLAVEGEDFRIRANGEYNLSSERTTGRLSLESPDITHAFSSMGVAEVSGEMLLEAEVSGLLRRPQAHLVLDGSKMRFQDYGIGDVRLAGTLDPSGTFRLAELRLKNQGSRVEGHGSVGIYDKTSTLNFGLPLNLSLALHNVELTDFVKETIARGALDGEVMVSGSLKELKGQAHIRGKHLAVRALRLGDLNGKIGLAEGRLNIHQLDLQNKDSAIRIAGAVDLFHREGLQIAQDPTFELRIQGDRVFVNDFIDKSRGRLTIAANFEGSLSDPKGSLSLEGTELDFGVQKLDRLELLATLDGKRLLIKPIRLTVVPGETIEANGWVSLNKDYDLALVSRGISLEHIDLLNKRVGAKGSLICDLSGSGSWEDPEFHGKMVLQRLEFRGKPLEDISVAVNMENQVAQIFARQGFDLQGTFHLKNQDFTVSLLLDETDLAPYFRLADRTDFSGVAAGSIKAGGNLKALPDLDASLHFERLRLLWQDKELIRTENARASIKDRHLSVPPVEFIVGPDGFVRLQGSAKHNGMVTMQAKGEIALSAVGAFIEAIPSDVKGRLAFSADVEGPQSRPQIHAEVDIDQVGFTVPGLLQKLDGLKGRIRVATDRIEVDHLHGKLDSGRFDLTAEVEMEAFTPTKILARTTADALPLRVPDTLDLLVSADLKIDGAPEHASVQGEMVLLEGTYYKDFKISLLQQVTKRERKEKPLGEMPHPIFENTGLDLSIKRRNPLMVDNNLVHLQIAPDLRIVGKLGNPIIRGRATVESGKITYRNKSFEVKKGFIDFSNPYKTEPYIHIDSEVNVRHWLITLTLAGTPDELSFNLRSDPPEEDGDVLSLLVTGRTTQELIAGEGGAGKSPAQILAEAMAGTLSDDIKELTGLDTVEVAAVAEEGPDAVKVTLGKDLSKRMTVKYATESKDGKVVQRAIAEYRFLEHILFSGSQDTEGIFGGEVKFRLEFR